MFENSLQKMRMGSTQADSPSRLPLCPRCKHLAQNNDERSSVAHMCAFTQTKIRVIKYHIHLAGLQISTFKDIFYQGVKFLSEQSVSCYH
jgi:hypothetical protein